MTRARQGSRYAQDRNAARRRLQAQRFWRQTPAMEALEDRTLLSSLTAYIKGELDSLGAGSHTFSSNNTYTLGALSIDAPSISYTDLTHSGTDWSGTLNINAQSVGLDVGSLASTTISNFSGTYKLNGSLDSGAFAFQAGTMDVGVANVFSAAATNVSIGYDPQPSTTTASKLNIDIAGATGTIIPFDNAQVKLSDLTIDDTGFQLANASLSAGNVTLGGIIAASGVQLSLNGVSESSTQPLAGTIGLTAGGVTLFPGATSGFTASLSDFQGSYTVGGNAAPTLTAGSATVAFGDALVAQDTGLTITGTTNGSSPNITSVSISSQSATISAPRFSDLKGTINAFTISPKGFDIGSASLSGTITMGSLLTATDVTLSATDLNYDATTNTLANDFAIGLTAGSVALFPAATAFTTTIAGFQGTYDAKTGLLNLDASEVTLSISNMLKFDSTDVAFTDSTNDPSQYKLSFKKGTLSSPRLSKLPSAEVDGFTMDSSGFSLASATLAFPAGSSTSSIDFGSLLELDNPVLTVDNLAYKVGATTPLSADKIALTADSVKLFPGATAFTTSITGLAASYDIPSTELKLSATGASLSISDFLQVTATSLSFTDVANDPSQYSLTFDSAVLASPRLSGLSVALSNFQLDSAGFSLAQADLTGSFRLGTLLEADNVDLSVTNLDYATATGSLSADSIGFSAGSVALFPGQTAFTSSVTGLKGSYDLSTGALNVSATGASLSISDIFHLDATGLTFNYDTTTNAASSYSLTIATATFTSPRFSGLTGDMKDFTLDQGGFSISKADLKGTVKLGSLLELDQADLAVTNLKYDATTGTLDSGWGITLTAGAFKMFPGNSSFTTTVTNFKGTYDSSSGALNLSADEIKLQLGSLATMDITAPTFSDNTNDPSSYVLTIAAGTLTMGKPLDGLSADIKNLTIDSSGFDLSSFDLKGNLTLGSVVQADGVDLNLKGMKYVSSTHAFSTNDINLTIASATLFPGAKNLTTATVTDLNLDLNLAQQQYSLSAGALSIVVPNSSSGSSGSPSPALLDIEASGLAFSFQTNSQGNTTFSTSVASATVSVPQLGVKGSITGLTIDNSGLTIGSATLSKSGTITLGDNKAISLTDPSVTITGFSYMAGSLQFSGDLSYSATSASVNFSNSFAASMQTISGTIGLNNPSFSMTVGAFSLNLGPMSLSGSSIAVNTDPTATDLLSVGTLDASLAIPSIGTLSGSAKDFSLAHDQADSSKVDFVPGKDFAVSLNFDPGTLFSDISGKLPSWFPKLDITHLGVSWPDFSGAPQNFTLDISASVNATIANTISVSGFVNNLVIDPSLLAAGKSPIISISGAGLEVSGQLFGFDISGGMFLSTLDLNAEYQDVNNLPVGATDTTVKYHELYGGIEAGISLEGLAGFQVRLGFFNGGPLEVYFQANVPILLDPSSGLTLGGFFGSVDFGASVPTITDPQHGFDSGTTAGDLVAKLTNPGAPLPISTWQQDLATQVENIVESANSSPSGSPTPTPTLADLTKNMLIMGGATLYSEYASQDAFELQGGIAFDTQGHVLLAGSLTLGNTFSMQAEAYFNFAQVEQGQAQILVHALFPAPSPTVTTPPLVTAWGELAISYSSGSVTRVSGQPIGATGPALGSAVQFNNPTSGAATDYAQSSNPINLSGSSFSVEFWAQQGDSNRAEDLIGQAGQPSGLRIGFNSAGQLVARYGSTTITASNAADQKWHQWAVTYDDSKSLVTIYEDGKSVGSSTVAGPWSLSGDFLIGRSGDPNTPGFVGSMDEVRVWSLALDPQTIQANMDRSNLGGTSGLLAEWTFDEGTSPYPGAGGQTVQTAETNKTVLSDSSGNGNDATLYVGSSPAPDWTTVTLVALPQPSSTTTLSISLTGGVALGVSPAAVTLTGSVGFTYSTTTITLPDNSTEPETDVTVTVSGSLPIAPLSFLSNMSGVIELKMPNNDIKQAYLVGALYVTPSQLFSKLQNVGLTVDGFAYLGFNTSGSDQTIQLQPPNSTTKESFDIPQQSVTIWVHGNASFTQGGTSWFEIGADPNVASSTGADLYIHLGETSGGFVFQTYVDGGLILGPSSSPLLQASVQGVMLITAAGVAAQLQVNLTGLKMPGNLSKNLSFGASGSLLVQLNTTDQTETFTLPGYPSAPAGAGSTITIPDRPTFPDGTTPPGPEPFFLMHLSAGATLANYFDLSGSMDLVVAPNLITLDVSGTLTVMAGGQTVLTGSLGAGVIISSAGLVGAAEVTGLGLNAGNEVSITGSAKLEINTTGVATTVGQGTSDPITVPAGNNNLFAEVAASGQLSILSNQIADADADLTVTGDVTSPQISLSLHGDVNVSVLGNVTIDGSLTIKPGDGFYGGLSVVEQSAGGDFQQMLAKIGLSFSQSAEFQFEINTTGENQTVTGFQVDPLTHDVLADQSFTVQSKTFELDLGGSLTLFNNSFHMAGDFSFAVSPGSVTFGIDASIGLLGHNLTIDPAPITLYTSFVIDAQLQFGGSLSLAGNSNGGSVPFGVNGDFVFEINATGSSWTSPDGTTLDAHSAVIGIKNFSITVGSFTDQSSGSGSVSTSILVTVDHGVFTFAWQTSLSASFAGFSVTVSGGISISIGGSDGSFTIGGSANVALLIDSATVGALSGSFSFTVSATAISLDLSGSITVAGQSYPGTLDFATRSTDPNSTPPLPPPELQSAIIAEQLGSRQAVTTLDVGEAPYFNASVYYPAAVFPVVNVYLTYDWRFYTPNQPYDPAKDKFNINNFFTSNGTDTFNAASSSIQDGSGGTDNLSAVGPLTTPGNYTVVLDVYYSVGSSLIPYYFVPTEDVLNFTVVTPTVNLNALTGVPVVGQVDRPLQFAGSVTTDDSVVNASNGRFSMTYNWLIDNGATQIVSTSSTSQSDSTNPQNATVPNLAFTPQQTGVYTISLTAVLTDRLGKSYDSQTLKESFVVSPGGNTLTVDNASDSLTYSPESMTLRQAILIANEFPGNWTIRFAPDLTGKSIDLSFAGDESVGASALAIAAGTNVTIDGANAAGLTIDRAPGAPNMRLFYVPSGATLAIDNLTLRGGIAQGGSLGGEVGAGGVGGGAGLGGAIYDAGQVNMTGDTLVGNSAIGGLPGIGNAGSAGLPFGGSFGADGGFGGGGGGGYIDSYTKQITKHTITITNPFFSQTFTFSIEETLGGTGDVAAYVVDFNNIDVSYKLKDENPPIPAGMGGFGGGRGVTGGTWGSPGSNSSHHLRDAGGSGAGMGGALFVEAGTLTLTDSTLTQNTAQGGGGGSGMTPATASHPLRYREYFYNPGSGYGGAIFNHNGTVTITNDTITGNTAAAGAIPSADHRSFAAASDGGGVYEYNGVGAYGQFNGPVSSHIHLYDSIVSGDVGGSDVALGGFTYNQYSPTLDGSNNLIQNFDHGNQYLNAHGVVISSNNPQLAALGDYGGPTETMPIAANSPAASAGSFANVPNAPSTDQRGFAFAGTPSIGAFQYPGQTLTVNSNTDGSTGLGTLDLRQAVDLVDALSPVDHQSYTIQFASSLAGQSIDLASVGDTTQGNSALVIASGATLTIDASNAPGVTIDRAEGAPSMRLIEVAPHAIVTIQDLTLSGGVAQGSAASQGGFGGAIFNSGKLMLTGDTLVNNQAVGAAGSFSSSTPDSFGNGGAGSSGGPGFPGGFGGGTGGIFVSGGGAGMGGAIFNGPAGSLRINNSTLSNNLAEGGAGAYAGGPYPSQPGDGFGGAIFNESGRVLLNADTIAGNTVVPGASAPGDSSPNNAASDGGAFYNYRALATIQDTILAGSVGGQDLRSFVGALTGSYNLIQSFNPQGVPVRGIFLVSTADPELGPLKDNGGPTFTMEPAAGSPVIGAGAAISGINTDQRGVPRGRAGGFDIGAFNRPSPIVVTSATQTALAQALSTAETFSSKDGLTYTVQFASSLAGQTIDLTSAGDNSFGASAFAIPAGTSIILDGSKAPGLTIERPSGSTAMRLFYVAPKASLTIEDLTLSGGLAQGGSGYGGGGGGVGLGGAIYDAGQLTILGSNLVNNQAIGGYGNILQPGRSGLPILHDGGSPNGGSLGNGGGFGGGGGGGLPANLTFPTHQGGFIARNSGYSGPAIPTGHGGFGGGDGAPYAGGGGAGMGGGIFVDSGTLSLIDSTLSGDTAAGGQGGHLSARLYVGYDVQMISWGDGSNVPTSGQHLVIVGLDNAGLLHIRILGSNGTYTDTFETVQRYVTYLETVNSQGNVLSKAPESSLNPFLRLAISRLRQQIMQQQPPTILVASTKAKILNYVHAITHQSLAFATTLSYQAGGGAGYGGAIFNHNGAVNLTNVTIVGNAARPGGAAAGADGSGIYSYQDATGTASLGLAGSVIGESAAGTYDAYNKGGTVTGINTLVASIYGVPSGTVQTGTGIQLTPSATALSANETLTLSGRFLFTNVSGTTDLTIHWGDGTTTTQTLAPGDLQFSAQHAYSTNSWDSAGDVYDISVTVADTSGNNASDPQFQASVPVQVNASPVDLNAALSTSNPFLDGIDSTQSPPSSPGSPVQQIATFTLPANLFPDQLNSAVATVSWGDGTSSTATYGAGIVLLSGQTYAIELSHAYPASSNSTTYNITVQVALAGGIATIAGLPAQVVTIAPPSGLGLQGANGTVTSAGAITNQSSFTLAGQVASPGYVVTITDTSVSPSKTYTATFAKGSTGGFTAALANLAPGTHVLRVEATDPASNAVAAADYTVVVDQTAPTVASFVPAAAASQTAVTGFSLTLDKPVTVNLASASPILLVDGSVVPVTDYSVTESPVTSTQNGQTVVSPTQYQVSVTGYPVQQGQYTLEIPAADIVDLAGTPLAGPAIVHWVIDTTAPVSSVAPIPPLIRSDTIVLAVNSQDPSPAAGVVASGVASLAIYVAQDNGAFHYWTTVTADGSRTIVDYPAAEGHQYAFYSIATDAAGNVEAAKSHAEAGTYVPDLTPPVTNVASATPVDATAQFDLTVTGTDVGGSKLAEFAVYVKVDGGPARLIATVAAGSPDANGIYSATLKYGALADGELHAYQFFSVGTDGAGNVESSPLLSSQPATGPVRSLIVSHLFQQQPLAVTGILVQNGAVERSFIQTVDVQFNQGNTGAVPPLTTLIATNSIELIQHPLDGSSTALKVYTPSLDPGMFKVVDHAIELDFGRYGLGGVARGNLSLPAYWNSMINGDGYYEIALNLAGKGFTTHEYFYRLLGDVNGDQQVNASDVAEIASAIAEGLTAQKQADVNGDGTVNVIDRYLATRSEGRSLKSGLEIDG